MRLQSHGMEVVRGNLLLRIPLGRLSTGLKTHTLPHTSRTPTVPSAFKSNIFLAIPLPLCYHKIKQSFRNSISNLNILMPDMAFKRLFA